MTYEKKNIRLLPPIALDERQKQQMYQIEHRGFWFAYFGILALPLMSMIGAICIFIFTLLLYTKNGYFVHSPKLMCLCALIAAFFTFLLTFALLSATARACTKRNEQLEEECEEDEE